MIMWCTIWSTTQPHYNMFHGETSPKQSMATKLTLKMGLGVGPLVHVHRVDRPWELQLRGVGKGMALFSSAQGSPPASFVEDGDYLVVLESTAVQIVTHAVTQAFRAELVMR